jgi:D-aminopeptidase
MKITAKPRARGLGIPFDGTAGDANAITDVVGVLVGHSNCMSADKSVNTGVTAILPLGRQALETTPRKSIGCGIDSFVLGAWFTHNGIGEMTGTNCVEESGFLEGPIMLTNTASVGTVRDALIQYWLNELLPLVRNDPTKIDPDYDFTLLLPVVAETYDGWLNDILGFHVNYAMVKAALDGAKTYATSDQVEEGNVGGGTGMTCYDWKGGIGTSSRTNITLSQYDDSEPPVYQPINDPNFPKGYTVGVLVQANQGTYWDLVIRGVPVGTEMTPPDSADDPPPPGNPGPNPRVVRRPRKKGKSSIIVVIATDAPLLPGQLKRLARRACLGIGRTGTITNDDSGEIAIAFTTANQPGTDPIAQLRSLPDESMDFLFEATVGATEEAIINALVAANTLQGRKGHTGWGITDPKLQELTDPNPTLIDVMKNYKRFVPPPKHSTAERRRAKSSRR